MKASDERLRDELTLLDRQVTDPQTFLYINFLEDVGQGGANSHSKFAKLN